MEILNSIPWDPRWTYVLGWNGVLFCFLTGAVLGLVVKNDANLGGYDSIKRRYVRLGHIACGALGIINIMAAICAKSGFFFPNLSLALLAVGLIMMPISCFIHAFTKQGYYFFWLPSTSLITAVVIQSFGGWFV